MELVQQRNISWQDAQQACGAALQYAGEVHVQVAVAVVDSGGQMIAFLRSPQAPFHCSDIAQDKAYTAVSFKLATHRWSALAKEFSPAVMDGLRQRQRMVMFGGGFPIMVAGECVGAIGVSGASETEDMQCAMAALELIGAEIEGCQ